MAVVLTENAAKQIQKQIDKRGQGKPHYIGVIVRANKYFPINK
jgi:hypothetical protein